MTSLDRRRVHPKNEMPVGKLFPLDLEAWPCGCLYGDLDNGTGHLWIIFAIIADTKPGN
jgi:hypothetical protein